MSNGKIRTTLCNHLNIEIPIIQAPIGSATCPELAAAVSNAGGLGMLSVTWRNLDEVRRVIRATQKLTNRPFGVNLVLEWEQEERLRVCLEEGVSIISFFWGDPTPLIQIAHNAGATVMHTVASAKQARHAVDVGVDLIVAQGWEAGGHVLGQVSTLPLIPSVVDAVSPVPVVAAGGISDGRGLAAVLALGAEGAWIGTRFLASHEATVNSLYKEKILAASETDTLYSTLFDIGWSNAPHRVLRNSTVKQWENSGCPPSGQRPGEGETIAYRADGSSIVRYSHVIPLQDFNGNLESLALYAGQATNLVTTIKTASDILQEIVNEAILVLRRSENLIQPS